ncbi:hypothetical protein AAFN86_16010 [Roseomonas sp. CAU 1739]|uniref:hypothetical protein n=1 Tax=Roseomonas sp. CAU 1739 TaxID=3140364 RepID=UPI00325BC6FF
MNDRLMRVLQRVPTMAGAQLTQLEDNARRHSTDPAAQVILHEIGEERRRRVESGAKAEEERADAIASRVADLNLTERLGLAFTEIPLSDAELARLRVLHDHPDQNEYELMVLAGDRGPSAFNLIIGMLCYRRRAYLPAPPPSRTPNEEFWSGLVCELTPRNASNGSKTHGWRLRPETVLALRRLALLPEAA